MADALANLLAGSVSPSRAALKPYDLTPPPKRNPFDDPGFSYPKPDYLDVPFGQLLSEGAAAHAQDFGAEPETAGKLGELFSNVVQLYPPVSGAATIYDVSNSKDPATIWAATQAGLNAVNPLPKVQRIVKAIDSAATPQPMPTAADDLAAAIEPPPTRTFSHPVSKVKLQTPIEEMHMTYEPFGEMRPENPIHPETLLGSTVIPMRGDPTPAGKTLTHIGGEKLETPVDMSGGPGFPRMQTSIDEGAGWASQPGASTTLSNRAAEIHKETGEPVHGVYMKMSETSPDFSTMMADTLHQMFKMKRSKIAKADIEAFDKVMREDALGVNKRTGKADLPAYADWPGIENLTPEYIRKGSGPKGDGKVRTKMAKLMDTKYWQDRGFPEAGYARVANTEPNLLNTPSHTSGAAVIKFDPQGRVIKDPKVRHPTYAQQNMAEEVGVLPELPLDVLYGPEVRASTQPQYLAKILETKPPSVKVDRQTLDRVMKYLRSQDGAKWGLGGAVTAGILSQEQADELNPRQEKASQQ